VLRALLWRFHNADTSNGYQLLTRWSANPSRIASKSANRRIDELQASLTEERHRIDSRALDRAGIPAVVGYRCVATNR
jgi:hypothetical protein